MKNTMAVTREFKALIAQIRSLCRTIEDILNDTTVNESVRYNPYKSMAHIYNALVEKAKSLLQIETIIGTFDIHNMPGINNTTWEEQRNLLVEVLLSGKMLLSSLECNLDYVDDEVDNLVLFIQSRLRSAIFQKPEKEIEIQNAIETLLLGRGLSKGIDYDRETGKFEFSGKEYIPDFVISKLSLCIEVKLLRAAKRSKVIEEISADITAYKKEYPRQLYVVYDLGEI